MTGISEGQWNLLLVRRAREADSIAVSDAGVALAWGRVLFGVDVACHRHLLVPVENGEVIEDYESQGVQVGTRTLSDRGSPLTYADLVCTRPPLASEFGHIVSDVLEALRNGAPAHRVCRDSLEKWRDLLRAGSKGRLDDRNAIGLFGELLTLRRLARISPTAVMSWTGPEGGRFDFTGADVAVEVKTSTRRYGRLVEISGETQLDAPAGVALHLMYIRLERVPAGGEGLGDVYSAILTSGVPAAELQRRIRFLDLEESEIREDSRRFRAIETRLYRVAADFPRIVPSSFAGSRVPPGALHLRYVIDISGEPPVPLGATETESLFRELVTGLPSAGIA